jgi:5-formyltetrahydrofolate cyclo-ligase
MVPRLSSLRTHLHAARHSAVCRADRAGMSDFGAAAEKQAVRVAVRGALRELDEAAMAAESAAAAAHLLSADFMRQARRVGVYVHCARLREVDTGAVLAAALAGGARVYVPRVQDSDANMHFLHIQGPEDLRAVPPFGILEPHPTRADGSPREDALEADAPLEVVVLPGLAFDGGGRRLGRGGGYYDKFVAACRRRAEERGWAPPVLAALAFGTQVVGRVPVAPHDQRVDVLATAEGLRRCTARGRAAG